MNYQGFDIHQDLTIWKDGKQFFQAIPCYSVRDAELLIDSYLMAEDITDKAVKRLPCFSNYELLKLIHS